MWLRWLLLFRNLRHGHYAFIADCFLHFVRLLVVYLKQVIDEWNYMGRGHSVPVNTLGAYRSFRRLITCTKWHKWQDWCVLIMIKIRGSMAYAFKLVPVISVSVLFVRYESLVELSLNYDRRQFSLLPALCICNIDNYCAYLGQLTHTTQKRTIPKSANTIIKTECIRTYSNIFNRLPNSARHSAKAAGAHYAPRDGRKDTGCPANHVTGGVTSHCRPRRRLASDGRNGVCWVDRRSDENSQITSNA